MLLKTLYFIMESEDSSFTSLSETFTNIDENSLINYILSEDNLSENDYSLLTNVDLDIGVRELMESIDQLKCENTNLQKQNSDLKEINEFLSLFNKLLFTEVLNVERKHIFACKEASFIITDLKRRLDILNFDIKQKLDILKKESKNCKRKLSKLIKNENDYYTNLLIKEKRIKKPKTCFICKST